MTKTDPRGFLRTSVTTFKKKHRDEHAYSWVVQGVVEQLSDLSFKLCDTWPLFFFNWPTNQPARSLRMVPGDFNSGSVCG